MSVTLFKEVNYSLAKIVQNIEMGEIGLPEIQHPFVWPNTKVRDLFDSMYRGFPVGYLLFWTNSAANGHRGIGAGPKQKPPHLLVIDGQQRLTSLFAVMKGIQVVREDYEPEYIYIAFRPRDEIFEVADAAIRRDFDFIPDISELWHRDVPLSRFVKKFLRQLRDRRSVTEEEEDQISDAIGRLYNLQSYPFAALEQSS